MLNYIPQGKEVQWSSKAFKKMKSLRMLIIRNTCVSRGPSYLPNSLRILDWGGYPSGSLPPDFHPINLAILKLPGSCLILDKPFKLCIIAMFVFLWLQYKLHMKFSRLLSYHCFQNMMCLTSMDFTDSKFQTELPDMSRLSSLRRLYPVNCTNQIKLHKSVGLLDHLEELSVQDAQI